MPVACVEGTDEHVECKMVDVGRNFDAPYKGVREKPASSKSTGIQDCQRRISTEYSGRQSNEPTKLGENFEVA